MLRHRTLLLLGFFFTAATLTAADWTRFRGDNGTGIVSDTLPTSWSPTKNITWKTALDGKGNSSPIIVKGKLFLQTASKDGSKRSLVCLDAKTGDKVWTKDFPGQPTKVHAKSSLASCTPSSDGTHVYTAVWDGDGLAVHAVDFAGKIKWTTPFGSFKSQHGAGLSPVVHEGRVYVNFDSDDVADVVALDAKTGEKSWRASRKVYRACYSSPIVRTLDGGKTEIIIFTTAGATGYDPASGAVNWSWTIPWKDGEMALRSVASPFFANGTLVCVTGDGSGSRYSCAVSPKDGTAKLEWEKRSSKLAPYVPCPIVKGDHIYWITDQGIAECLELKTGKILWSERVVNAAVSASPILARDNLYIIDETGKAVVIKADPKGFEKVGTGDVGEAVFASPAVADGKLYIRGANSVFCISLKPS
jgi:outer membrane protein assembly factor BamB